MPTTRTACAAALIALSLPLAACSSGADSRKGADSAASTGASATAQTPAQRLAAVKKVMDASPSLHLTLSSTGVPDTATGVLRGEGTGTKQPGFKGDLTAKLSGIQADIPVVALKDDVWAKLPIWPNMRTIDPKTYGAPNPASLFSTDKGISSLLPRTTGLKAGAERRDGSDTVRVYTGSLTGEDVVDVLNFGRRSGTYQVEYLITPNNQLRQAKVTGVFFNDGGSSAYTLRLDKYGEQFEVTAPA
ncbi:LppX_LprAFG lipoprotein [Dermacoccaceae bacterium W4C1]